MILLRLGPELLGAWGILKAVVIFPSFVQSALSVAIFLQISRQPEVSRVNEALSLSFIFSLFVASFLIFCAPYLAEFFRIPNEHLSMMISALRISGITFIVTSLSGVFLETMQGRGRFDIVNFLNTGFSLINSFLSLFLLTKGYKVLSLIFTDLLTNCLLLAALFFFFARTIKQLPSIFSIQSHRIVSLLKETSAQLTYAGLVKILWELDALIISRAFGIQKMSSYWIGQRLAYAWKGLLWSGIWPVVPEAVEDSPTVEGRLQQIHWLQSLISIPTAAALIYFAADIIQIWTSKPNSDSTFVLRMLTLAVLVDFFPATYISAFFAQGKVMLLARYILVGIIIKLCLTAIAWILADFRLLIISTTSGAVLFGLILISSVTQRQWAQVREFLKPALPPLLASLVTASVLSIMSRPHNWNEVALQGIVFLGFSFFLTFFLMKWIFHKDGRDLLNQFSESLDSPRTKNNAPESFF